MRLEKQQTARQESAVSRLPTCFLCYAGPTSFGNRREGKSTAGRWPQGRFSCVLESFRIDRYRRKITVVPR